MLQSLNALSVFFHPQSDGKILSELLIENIPWDVRDIQVVGNRIYLATGATGLKILRINYPYQMFLPFISASE
jgi:hypothetical protein